MSPNMKISLLALVGAAAAIPHYSAHSKFHLKPSGEKASGYAGPTGGWAGVNHTGAAPTGSGYGTGYGTGTGVVPVGDKTTTLQSTETSTETIVKTIYATKSKAVEAAGGASAVGVADVSGGPAECGPATVYVTATNKVTITVPAGGAAASSYASPAASPISSAVPEAAESSAAGYPVHPVSSSSAASASAVVEEAGGHKSRTHYSSAAVVPPKESSAAVFAPPKQSSAAVVAPPTESSAAVVAPPKKSSALPVAPSATPAAPTPAPESSAAAPTPAAPASEKVPVASATPSKTPTSGGPGYSGGKRGLAYRWDGAADAKTYENSNMGFSWNWEADTKGDIGSLSKNFIPTLRTLANIDGWESKVDTCVAAGSKVVFGFNEPDRPDQAGLTAQAACQPWKDNMNPIAAKHPEVTIVGPSVSNGPDGLKWLSDFKTQCPEAIWHEANIHWYDTAAAGFDGFKKHIDEAISLFGKVWVTEFSLNPGATVEQSKDFLEKATAYLDSTDGCVGYSYFAVGNFDPSFNMLGTATAPTEVGKIYIA